MLHANLPYHLISSVVQLKQKLEWRCVDDGMCLFPGLKPGQRKVLFTCLKRNDKREVKVAQLAGSVAEMSAYHHGEVQCICFD